MARLVFEENYGVFWLPAITDETLAEVTASEITAGTDITAFIPKDGLNPGSSNNTVDVGDLSSAYDATEIGSFGHSLSVTFYKDDEADTAWDEFPRGTRGYLVVSPFNASPTSGDALYVWKCAAGEPSLPSTAANTQQTFSVEFAVQDANMRAAATA